MVSRFGHFRFMHWHDPAALDVEVAEDQLEGDFLAGVGRGVVDLAEAPAADGPLDRVAVERPGSRTEGVAALCLGSWVGVGHVGISRGLIGPGTRKVFGLVNGRLVHVRARQWFGRRAHHFCNSTSTGLSALSRTSVGCRSTRNPGSKVVWSGVHGLFRLIAHDSGCFRKSVRRPVAILDAGRSFSYPSGQCSSSIRQDANREVPG